MENQNKSKKSIVIIAFTALMLCLVIAIGATFGLFTDQKGTTITVNSGNFEIEATIADLRTGYDATGENGVYTFENGGSVKAEDSAVKINGMAPNDEVTFTINITNKSDIKSKIKISFGSNIGEMPGVTDLYEALEFSYTREAGGQYTAFAKETDWVSVDAKAAIAPIYVKITFPEADNNNDYKGALSSVAITIDAVQGNGNPA